MASAFRGWQDAVAQRKRKRAVLRGATLRLQHGCLARALSGWRDAAQYLRDKHAIAARAVRHWAAAQLSSAYLQWQAWAARSAENRRTATGIWSLH